MDPKRNTIALIVSFGVLLTLIVLCQIRYERRVQKLVDRIERFEGDAARAFFSTYKALKHLNDGFEETNDVVMQTMEIVLTKDRLRLYNAKTKPIFLISDKGEQNGQTEELLRTEGIEPGTPYGTGPWDDVVPVFPAAP